MRHFLSKGTHGFTLLELIVTIGIIAMLTAMAFSSAGFEFNKANDNQTVENAKTFTVAIDTYYNEYGYYPIATVQYANNFDTAKYDSHFIQPLVAAGYLQAGVKFRDPFWYGGYAYAWRDTNPAIYNKCTNGSSGDFNDCLFTSFCKDPPGTAYYSTAKALFLFVTAAPLPASLASSYKHDPPGVSNYDGYRYWACFY